MRGGPLEESRGGAFATTNTLNTFALYVHIQELSLVVMLQNLGRKAAGFMAPRNVFCFNFHLPANTIPRIIYWRLLLLQMSVVAVPQVRILNTKQPQSKSIPKYYTRPNTALSNVQAPAAHVTKSRLLQHLRVT